MIINWFDILKEMIRIPMMLLFSLVMWIMRRFNGGILLAMFLGLVLTNIIIWPTVYCISFGWGGVILAGLIGWSFWLFMTNDVEETFLKDYWRLVLRSLWRKMFGQKVIRYNFERREFVIVDKRGIVMNRTGYIKRMWKVLK